MCTAGGVGPGQTGDTQAGQGRAPRAGGSPRERSVCPRCQWGGRCRGAGRVPPKPVSPRCQVCGLSGSSGLRQRPHPPRGGAVCLESQQATPPASVSPPGEPHAGTQFWAPRARESSHGGRREFVAGPHLQKDQGLPETTCSGKRWATPLPLSMEDVQIGEEGVSQSSPLSVPEAGPLGRGLPRHPLPREEGQRGWQRGGRGGLRYRAPQSQAALWTPAQLQEAPVRPPMHPGAQVDWPPGYSLRAGLLGARGSWTPSTAGWSRAWDPGCPYILLTGPAAVAWPTLTTAWLSPPVLAKILLLIQPRVTVNEVGLGARLSPWDVWEAGGGDAAWPAPCHRGLWVPKQPWGQVTRPRPRPQGGRDSGLAVRPDRCQSPAAWAD